MAAQSYTTRDGDMIDLICYRHYKGRQAGAVEIVLEANRAKKLADYGPVLPRGIVLTLPEMGSDIAQVQLVKLWD